MADTKFTPGPWEACDRETYQAIYAKGYERAFCQVDSYSEGFGPNRAERDANAHLIAAATELYAEIERAMKARVELIESGDCGFWDPNDDGEVLSMRKALAKARGEAA